MATVYLATQVSLARSVVLKVLDVSRQADNPNQIERFLAEGRIVASLNHPNIITIYDIGVTDDNALYISMEYIKGGDLKSRIGIPMDIDEALYIVSCVASGLNAAHEHGIVHRDVKPANILFRDDGSPLLTDFGIAKQADNDLNLTSTGVFLGSPNYVSPEQADGSEVDGRTDIYSLGCIFYEMLTGEKPFKSETLFDVVMKHKNAPIPQLPDDLQLYQPLLNTMMAKKPDDRFANAGELIEFINGLRGNNASRARTVDFDITMHPAAHSHRRTKRSFVILMVLLTCSLIFFVAIQYVDIRLKNSSAIDLDRISVNTTISDSASEQEQGPDPESTEPATPPGAVVSEDVINALHWLGRKSLEEFKLTYPPKDNAYYYYSRLLEFDPSSETARQGVLEIADRYAILAEKSLAANEYAKTEAYINIGLKINPQNEDLLSLRKLNEETKSVSFLDTLKGVFK